MMLLIALPKNAYCLCLKIWILLKLSYPVLLFASAIVTMFTADIVLFLTNCTISHPILTRTSSTRSWRSVFLNTDLACIRCALILTSISALWDLSLHCPEVSAHCFVFLIVRNYWALNTVGCYNIVFLQVHKSSMKWGSVLYFIPFCHKIC